MKKLYEGSITRVHGIRVGQAQDESGKTGVTVILCPHDGATVSCDVRGAAPGTRETDLCEPSNTVEKANAIVLAGGSAFGLAAADGVMAYLEKAGMGVDMGVCHVPIVPAAVLFDLTYGDAKARPDAKMGAEAVSKASKELKQGSYGAGTGATVGKLVPGAVCAKGGVGTASITLPGGATVGAIVACNACGDIYSPKDGRLLACGRLSDGTQVTAESLLFGQAPAAMAKLIPGGNTTIGCVATDAILTKSQLKRLATCAHDGYARTIRPVHTQMDGDTVFALSTGRVQGDVNLFQLCAAAAEVTARAIHNAVLAAMEA